MFEYAQSKTYKDCFPLLNNFDEQSQTKWKHEANEMKRSKMKNCFAFALHKNDSFLHLLKFFNRVQRSKYWQADDKSSNKL